MNSPNESKQVGREKVKGKGCLLALYLLVIAISIAVLLFWALSP